MTLRLLILGCVGLLAGGTAWSQTLNNASLNGKYYFVHLMVTASGGAASDVRNLSGSITFNGAGGYSYTGRLGTGAGAPGASSGNGTYTVTSAGDVTLTNPIRNSLQVIGRLGADAVVVLGASTEAADNTNDIFVAVKAPAANVSNTVLNGAYTGGTLAFPNGSSARMKSAVVSLAPNGGGRFTRVTVVGHAADQGGGRNVSQEATNATYNINADGTGSAAFGSAAALFSGGRDIFVSQDGNYILGASTGTGEREIFIATKNFGASASAAAFDGRYVMAELIVDGSSFSAASGSVRAFGNGRAVLAQRLHLDTSLLDFTGVNSYTVNSDSTGSLAPLPAQGVNNMALGVSVNVGGTPRPNTVVGAQIGAVNAVSSQYGIFFAVRAPSFTGTGVFLDPTGVVVNASFPPAPNPICAGVIASLFGAGLAPRRGQPTALPLPTTLEGVSVSVNGTAAALFFVSPGQIDIQVPFGLTGNTATITVNNGGTRSNEVTLPLARTCPGIFSYADARSQNRAIIIHADGSLVTPQSPARPGETVIIFLTGLGALNPAVPTGAGNPSSPLATPVDRQIQVLFGGEVATNVPFIGGTPGFAGLLQINVVIPLTVVTGTNVPVAISTGNAFTDLVDISIGI